MIAAPALEMLWEPHDPRHALAATFGFPDAETAGRWVAGMIDQHWGVRIDSCDRIVMSDCNALAWLAAPAGRLLAKWSVATVRFPRLAATAHLTAWLDARGLPVSAPVPTRDGRLQVEVDGVSMGLQRQLAGELLDTGDLHQVRAAGALLARCQEALAAYPGAARLAELAAEPGTGRAPASPPAPLPVRITGWLDNRAAHLPAAARDRLRSLVAGAPPEGMGRQLLHSDFRSANILWAGGEITAVLDFEDARQDHPLVEVARAAILLGTRYHHWGPVPAAVREEFVAGYRAVRPLTPDETAWLHILLLWQALMMVPAGDDPTGWGESALSLL